MVSLSLFTPDFDLFDVNRVEMLRGPLGTLRGAGSVADTGHHITNPPELGWNHGFVEDRFNSVAHGNIGQPSDQVAGAGQLVSGLAYGGATSLEVAEPDLKLDPYTLVGLRFAVRQDDWEAALHLDNLTDGNARFSFDRERGGRARLGCRVNRPCAARISIGKSF